MSETSVSPANRTPGNRYSFAAVLAAVLLSAGSTPAQTNGTWTQNQTGTYNWGDTTNWQGGTIASGVGATGTLTPFGITGPININLETSYTVGNLFFDNPSNAFPWTVSTNAGATLTLATSTGTPTITVGNNLTTNMAVVLQGTQGFTKVGGGTLSLSAANTYTGTTVVNGGVLQLDFTQGTTTDILPNPGALTLGNGGSLSLLAVGGTLSQTIGGGLTLNAGAATITANLATGGGALVTLNLNTITRNTGSQINFIVPNAGATINVSNANTNGILGGWAIYTNNSNGATGFAANNGSNVVIPLATYSANNVAGNFVAANNIDSTTNGVQNAPAAATFNSLRYNNGGGTDYTLNLTGANTIGSGGILVTAQVGAGANALVTGGTLTSGSPDLVFTQLNFYKPLTITSQITGAVGLTTAGIGTTVLGASNNYTGQTTVGGGTLLASTTSALPGYNTSGQVVVLGGGTLSVSTSDAGPWLPADIDTLRANATFNAGSALGFDVSLGNSLTYASNLSGALGVTKNNDGTLVLTGNSNFTGLTTINGGVLSAGSIANAGQASAIGAGTDLVFSLGGTFQYTGASASVDRGVNLQFNGGQINVSTAGTNLGLSGLVYGVGGLTKSGPGTLTISGTGTYSGPTLVTAGTLVFSGANSIPSGNNLTIFSGATVTIGAAATPTLAGLSGGGTLNLGAATQLNIGSDSGSGSFQGTIVSSNPATLALVKNGSGIQVLIGGNNYGGGTTINGGTLLLSPQTAAANPLGTGPVTLATAGVTLAYRQLLPVPTTGYNRDVIYGVGEGANTPIRSTADLKATVGFDIPNNLVYYSNGVPGPANNTTGLPKNLAINSLVGGGSTFIMQPYNANNVVFIPAGGIATMGIGSPGSFKSVNLLTASTNGATTFTATLNFQDGSSTIVSGLSAADWFNGTAGLAAGGGSNPNNVPGAISAGLDRYNFITNTFDNNTTNPRLYQVGITLSNADSAKVLTSITLASQATGATAFGVFALNGTTSGAPATVSPGNNVAVTAAGTTNLEVSGYTAVNFGNLTLNGTAGANTVALTGTAGSTMGFTGTTFVSNAPTLNIASGLTMALGTLTDANAGIGFTKQGTGTLILAGGTNYTGGTSAGSVSIQAGTVIAQTPSALPGFNTSGTIALSSGAALVVGFGGTGQFTQANITTLLTNVNFVAGSQFGLDVASGTQSFTNTLALPAGVGFAKTGNGVLVLGNANAYTGGTTISGGELSAGVLTQGGSPSSIGSSAAAAGNLVFNNGALLLYTGPSATTNRSFTLNAGLGTASGGGFDISTAGTTLTVSGASTGAGILYKSGPGTLVLTGANAGTGGVTIGTITFVNGVPVIGNGGGTLQVGVGGTAGSISTTGAIIDNGTLAFNRSDAITQSNAISGTGNVVKLGTGTLTLSGVNTYTGTTTVSAGVLQAGSTSAFGTGSAVSVAAGATLALNGNSNTIGSLSGAGIVTNNSGTNAILTTGDPTNTTFSGVIQNGAAGSLALVKTGTGTLTLTGTSTFSGGVTLQNGTLAVSTDAGLGTGNFTGSAFGTLSFTQSTATSRSFNLGTGTLSVASGATLTVNGGLIGGGYVGGSGSLATSAATGGIFSGLTTQPSVAINSNSGSDRFQNFTNGGAVNVAAGLATAPSATGFTNEGSGSVTVGAGSTFNVANFQTYGTVTVTPASGTAFTQIVNTGSTPLYFNGGSRTFVGTPATAAAGTAGIDLNGKNGIVAGGLFVNNGVVFDSTSTGATLVADFGARIKGAGLYQTAPATVNGGIFQAGNSPGVTSVGSINLGAVTNNLQFQINNATGVAGPSPDVNNQVSGWSLFNVVRRTPTTSFPGDVTWSATPAAKVTIAVQTLTNPTTVGNDVAGPMANFNSNQSYSWTFLTYAHSWTGPTDDPTLNASTTIDTSQFANAVSGTFSIHLDTTAQTLSLVYTATPVPEPTTVGLVAVAGLAVTAVRRVRRKAAT
jgi:autotransporter-associated beta strand protein